MKSFKKVLSVILGIALLVNFCVIAVPTAVSAETTYPAQFVKLDGTEWPPTANPILNDGGTGTSRQRIDRDLNFVEDPGNYIYNYVTATRAENPATGLDFSGADDLVFNFTVGETWSVYKDYFKISLISQDNQKIAIPDANLKAAFADVVPGKASRVRISLDGLDKTAMTNIYHIEFKVEAENPPTADNLHITVSQIFAELSPEKVYPVTLAELTGGEWPIVNPGGGWLIENWSLSADAPFVNFIRTNCQEKQYPAVDISGADVLTFNFTAGDTWDELKDYFKITIDSQPIPDANLEAAFADIVPGKTQKVAISLDGMDTTRLYTADMVEFKLADYTGDSSLLITVTKVKAEVLPTEPLEYAKLDWDWPIVNPGLDTDESVATLNRYLNFTSDIRPDVKDWVYVERTANNWGSRIDISLYDQLSFNFWVEDNGAWDFYKDYLEISIDGQIFSKAAVEKAFSGVVPGIKGSVKLDLDDINKGALTESSNFTFKVAGSTCDLDLHIKIDEIYATMDNNDEVILLDDENGEVAPFMGAPDIDIAKVGTYSYVNQTYTTTVLQAGFWGGSLFEIPKDISEVTANGTKGALRFWFWVKDNDTLNDLHNCQAYTDIIAIGDKNIDSSNPDGPWGALWTGWTSQLTRSGWNEVVLPFTPEAKPNTDWTAICSMRFKIGNGSSDVIVAVDNLKVTADTYYSTDIAAAGDDVILIDDENLNISGNGDANYGRVRSTNSNSIAGVNSLKYTVDPNAPGGAQLVNEGWLVFTNFYGASPLSKDISTATANGKDGTLRFWFYVENDAILQALTYAETALDDGSYTGVKSFVRMGTGAADQVDITDYRKWDGWVSQVTKVGWNEIILDFGNSTISGNPDYTNITHIDIRMPQIIASDGKGIYEEIYSTCGSDLGENPFYIDDIRISNSRAASVVYGDANNDGARNILDLIVLKKALLDNDPMQRAFDVCYDGLFNANDLIALRKILFGVK